MITVAAGLLVSVVFVLVLLIRKEDIPEPVPVSPVQHLEDRKQAIYESLRDLQFEYRISKLSDDDYKSSKLALQRELAVVLAEMEETIKLLGLTPVRVGARAARRTTSNRTRVVCPHCGAKFNEALRYCGHCGKAIA